MRDAERIVAAAKAAGLTRIDTLITTHWHGDHYGGMAELAARMPIRHFHRPRAERATGAGHRRISPEGVSAALRERAASRRKARRQGSDGGTERHHRVVGRRGDQDAAAGRRRRRTRPARTSNPGEGNAEDPMSVGTYVTYGRFRTVHLGDLTKQKEFELMCPNNRIGTVDVFLGLAPRRRLVELRGDSRPSSARRDHEQRHAQRRSAGRDEGGVLVAGSRGFVADAFLAARAARNTPFRACSSRTCSTSRRRRCRSRRLRRRRLGRARRRRRCTTVRRTGSRCRRRPTDRSR